jgi:hypothetical protein
LTVMDFFGEICCSFCIILVSILSFFFCLFYFLSPFLFISKHTSQNRYRQSVHNDYSTSCDISYCEELLPQLLSLSHVGAG